jgi:hypothetical protein
MIRGLSALFAVALATAPVPSAAAPAPCSAAQVTAARRAQADARLQVLAALRILDGSRPDGLTLARAILGEEPRREEIRSRLTLMYSHLAREALPLRCAAPDEEACRSEGSCEDGSASGGAVVLCAGFFRRSVEQRARALVHASAHLARIGPPSPGAPELRCSPHDRCDGACAGLPPAEAPLHADSWAHFVQCASRKSRAQSLTPGGTERAGTRPGRSRPHP